MEAMIEITLKMRRFWSFYGWSDLLKAKAREWRSKETLIAIKDSIGIHSGRWLCEFCQCVHNKFWNINLTHCHSLICLSKFLWHTVSVLNFLWWQCLCVSVNCNLRGRGGWGNTGLDWIPPHPRLLDPSTLKLFSQLKMWYNNYIFLRVMKVQKCHILLPWIVYVNL